MVSKNKVKYLVIGVLTVAVLVGAYVILIVKDSNKLPSSVTEFTIVREDIPQETLDAIIEQFENKKQQLEEFTMDDPEWDQAVRAIGLLKFTVEDYKGAEEAWQIVYERFPEGYVANGNLGNLYLYFLKEYDKAEKHYLEALAIENIAHSNHYTYFSELLDLYQYATEDSAKAEALIERALIEIPESVYSRMKTRASDYYMHVGKDEKAKEVLERTREEEVKPDIDIEAVPL